jgi:3'-phosphoadenosine 5'-phosphosulfate sulfotransferase (PAPS reductase)/FAD synthetase
VVEERAKKILNQVRDFTVLWSGGKDSTAVLLWVLENVNHTAWNVLYIFTSEGWKSLKVY